MKESPLVTIVIPCYNVEKYIEKCIDSVLSQTYKKLEIILIDDGSTDKTREIIDNTSDARIKVIHKKNGGLSDARNTGIKNATGEYICFIDGDDFIDKTYIKKLLSVLLKTGADISMCGYKTITEGKKDIDIVVFDKAEVISGLAAAKDYLINFHTIMVIACNKLYKTSIFKENNIKYPTGKLHEDNYTTIKTLYFSKKIARIKEPLYYYVKRNTSITGSKYTKKHFIDMINVAEDTKDFFKKRKSGDDIKVPLEAYDVNIKSFALLRAVKNKVYCNERIETIKYLKSKKFIIKNNPYISKTTKALFPILSLLKGRKK